MDLQTMNTTNFPQEMEFYCFDKIQKEAYKLHQFTQPNNDEFIHQVSCFQFPTNVPNQDITSRRTFYKDNEVPT